MPPSWLVRISRLLTAAALGFVRRILPILIDFVFSLAHHDLSFLSDGCGAAGQ
jgi:hypothetical protein